MKKQLFALALAAMMLPGTALASTCHYLWKSERRCRKHSGIFLH